MQEIDVNDMVNVMLNETGIRIMNQYYADSGSDKRITTTPYPLRYRLSGLMKLFGPQMQVGMITPFVDNKIVIE
jgi:hypothetical protein